MTELACEFGKDNRLKGVLCWPVTNAAPKTAMILVSAGFTSKAGPYRMYAELARRVTPSGLPVLRFDLGGIGSSQALVPGLPVIERTRLDIRDALNFMEDEFGIERFVVGGLCSGGEDALRYAEDDPRVHGVLMIDPHAYRTARWSFHHIFSRNFVNRAVFGVLRALRVIRVVIDKNANSNVAGFEGSLVDYKYMERGESQRILKALVRRSAGIHYVFTAGRLAVFNHRNQVRKMFKGVDFGDLLTVDYVRHVEHLQVFEEDRETLIRLVAGRLQQVYAGQS